MTRPRHRYLSSEFFGAISHGLAVPGGAPAGNQDLVVHTVFGDVPELRIEQRFGGGGLTYWGSVETESPDLTLTRDKAVDHADLGGTLALGEIFSSTAVSTRDASSADLLGIDHLTRHGGTASIGASVEVAISATSPLGRVDISLAVARGRIVRHGFGEPLPAPHFKLACPLPDLVDWLHGTRQLGWLLLSNRFSGNVEVTSYLEGAVARPAATPDLAVLARYVRAREIAVDQLDAMLATCSV